MANRDTEKILGDSWQKPVTDFIIYLWLISGLTFNIAKTWPGTEFNKIWENSRKSSALEDFFYEMQYNT